jgi:hypothetical protein
MNLLVTYLVTIVIGQAAVVGIAILADRFYSPFVSLLIFFPLFFGMFWLAWRIAVRLTEPRRTTS